MIELVLTNLDRVLWPETGFTKGAMIDYYRAVAPVLLPHLRGRPLTLGRFPTGVDQKGWYQTNCRGAPSWIHVAQIPASRGPEVFRMCVVDDLDSLVWVANQGTIELHPYLSLAEAFDEPVVLVFDLDPGDGATLAHCCRVALLVRERLADDGLIARPKTSGSSGLHLYVGLAPGVTFSATRAYAKSVASELSASRADLVTDGFTHAERAGRVLIDWRQNERGRSQVAPYSLRATPWPLVSTPLEWSEVEHAASSADARSLFFPPAEVLERVNRSRDLFAPVVERQSKLPAAAERGGGIYRADSSTRAGKSSRRPDAKIAPMTTAIEAPTFGNFIGGEWRESETRRTFESRNPADTRDLIGHFAASDAADVAAAIRAAEEALPAWRGMPAPKRGEIMYAFAAVLAQNKERLAREMTREMGKVLTEARGDVQEGIDIAYLMAGEGRRMFGDTTPSELPNKWAMSIRQPIGIAAIITPWNFPIAIPCWKMTAALITGNTVVFKPASDTPHCAALLVEIMAQAGFPPGVVNMVTGSGEEVGMPLVENPDIHVISFTGNGDTGRDIAVRAARRLTRVSLELGGKNAIAVMADADLDLAVEGILWSAFGTTGQRCTAASRLVVDETVADDLLARLVDRARSMRLGSGLEPDTDVGPLINSRARDKVAGYVEIGTDEGARLIAGGSPATDDGLQHGHFFTPTILDGVRPMDRVAQEEIFGPVLSVIRVNGYDEVAMAVNSTRYGLSSSIFTRDTNTSFRAMRDFTTGIVYVNAGTIGAETHLPFGGMKQTGNGHREAGHVALDTFTEWKSIYVDYSGRLQRAQIDNQ